MNRKGKLKMILKPKGQNSTVIAYSDLRLFTGLATAARIA